MTKQNAAAPNCETLIRAPLTVRGRSTRFDSYYSMLYEDRTGCRGSRGRSSTSSHPSPAHSPGVSRLPSPALSWSPFPRGAMRHGGLPWVPPWLCLMLCRGSGRLQCAPPATQREASCLSTPLSTEFVEVSSVCRILCVLCVEYFLCQ